MDKDDYKKFYETRIHGRRFTCALLACEPLLFSMPDVGKPTWARLGEDAIAYPIKDGKIAEGDPSATWHVCHWHTPAHPAISLAGFSDDELIEFAETFGIPLFGRLVTDLFKSKAWSALKEWLVDQEPGLLHISGASPWLHRARSELQECASQPGP